MNPFDPSPAAAGLSAREARHAFLIAAAVTLLARGVLAAMLPFTGDEAYFYWWGRNPDWGFYDHPPMVGWWLAALSAVSSHPFVLRLPALIVPVLVALMTAAALRGLGPVRAWTGATLVLLMPLNAWNVAITTDIPLMLFCGACVVLYLRALRTGRDLDFLLAGLALAGALMSKYFAGLLALAILGHALSRPGPARVRGLMFVILGSLPAAAVQIAWNAQHCWPNVMFNLVNRHGNAGWSLTTPLLYAVSVAYVLTPVMLWSLLRGRGAREAGALRADVGASGGEVVTSGAGADLAPARHALRWLVAFPFALFALLSAVKTIGLHWLASFVAPAVMLFVLTRPAPALGRALRFAAGFALVHYLVLVALWAAPLHWFKPLKIYDGLVMTVRPQPLNARIAPYVDAGFAIASDGYSPAVTIGFNLQRYVFVFGPGSGHARHDDILTDFRALDGRDIVVVRRKPPEPGEYAPYFDRVDVREHAIEGAVFHFVEGRGFRYAAYRDAVLDEARRRWYAVPPWLPTGPCYFCDRYFPERACHR